MRTWELGLGMSHRGRRSPGVPAHRPGHRRRHRAGAAPARRPAALHTGPGERARRQPQHRGRGVRGPPHRRVDHRKDHARDLVADAIPSSPDRGHPRSIRSAFDLPPVWSGQPPARANPRVCCSCSGGVPDLRFVPHRELARALGQSLRGVTQPAPPRLRRSPGQRAAPHRPLPTCWHGSAGIQAPPSAICVVRGSQQALYLAARALLAPGDVVAVEACGYPPTWQVLRLAGCEPVPIPVDDARDRRGPARGALCDPARARSDGHAAPPHADHRDPVARASDAAPGARRPAPDDGDRGRLRLRLPLRRAAGLAARRCRFGGVVVYVGTLSKTLAPGLRLGYLVGGPEVVSRVTAYRTWVDQQGDQVLEQAVALLLEDGVVQRHIRRARRVYQARRDILCDALREHLPELRFRSRPAEWRCGRRRRASTRTVGRARPEARRSDAGRAAVPIRRVGERPRPDRVRRLQRGRAAGGSPQARRDVANRPMNRCPAG